MTAQNPEGRAKGLAKKIQELNNNGNNYLGGLVVLENNQWYYYRDSSKSSGKPFKYEYTAGKLNKDWVTFESLFD